MYDHINGEARLEGRREFFLVSVGKNEDSCLDRLLSFHLGFCREGEIG